MFQQAFGLAMLYDPDVFRGMMEILSMYALPEEVFTRPGFAERIAAAAEGHEAGPDRPGLPGQPGRALAALARLCRGAPMDLPCADISPGRRLSVRTMSWRRGAYGTLCRKPGTGPHAGSKEKPCPRPSWRPFWTPQPAG